MIQRTVTIKFDEEFAELVGLPNIHVDKVVGYLTGWAITNPKYCKVDLFANRDGDVHALYSDSQDRVTYSIYAKRQPNGEYTTHS